MTPIRNHHGSPQGPCNFYADHSLQVAKFELHRLCPVRDFSWAINGNIPNSLSETFEWVKFVIKSSLREKAISKHLRYRYNLGRFILINSSLNKKELFAQDIKDFYNPCKIAIPRIRSAFIAIYIMSRLYEWVPEAIITNARTEKNRVNLVVLIPDHFHLQPYFESSF